MKKYFNYFGGLVLAMGLAVSCDTVDFGDENLNPNQPSTASTAALLTNAIRTIPSHVSEVNSNLMVQYISEITYTEDSRYEQFEWSYDGWYSGPLKDLQEIIDLNSQAPEKYTAGGTTANQIAAARILQAYYFHYLTDRWGAVPYDRSEILKGAQNLKPAFAQQEDIYLGDGGLFDEIDAALAQIDDAGTLNGDILFDGNMAHWRKFANTLKMVMALRISQRNSGVAQTKFIEAHNAGVIGAGENIHYPYLTEDNNDNPWQDRFQTREDYAVSNVFIDMLNGANNTDTSDDDPRLARFAETNQDGDYVGCPYGVANPNVLQAEISFITDDIIYDGTEAGGMMFSYAQIAFGYAEAAHRGWSVPGDAATWYNIGIQASMAQWGVDAAAATAYANAHPISPTAPMESIAYEKYVALYMQGAEAWAEWRRLDHPQLAPAADALSGTGIPVRNGYSALTRELNADNYNAAIQAQGTDNQDTRLWWDVN